LDYLVYVSAALWNVVGMSVKILYALMGLSLTVLSITGVFMYWNRYLSKKWQQWKAGAESNRVAHL
jgi:hypothetical protein